MKNYITMAAIIIGTSAIANSNDDLLFCSAHFEARGEWGRVMEADSGYIHGMFKRSYILLEAYEGTVIVGPQDWGMSTGFGSRSPQFPEFENDRDDLETDALIYFANLSSSSGKVPFCMEDAVCQFCSDVLRVAAP